MQEFDFKSGIYQHVRKEDYVTTSQILKRIIDTPWIDIYHLWEIKKKPGNYEDYKDSELSE